MDTKLATTNIRIQQWLAVFKARNESGLKIDEYCNQNGISQNSYYYWLRKAKYSLKGTTSFQTRYTRILNTSPQGLLYVSIT